MGDHLKIESLDISNFKGIRKIHLDINGRSFIILGKNGSYKSTLIQAILSPLDSKFQPYVPVTTGEEQAKVELVLSGEVGGLKRKYQLEMYFSATTNKGRLVLYNEAGEKINSPATFIKNLVGNISFDIMTFLKSDKTKKIKILRELSGRDKEITACEFKIDAEKKKKSKLEDKMSEIEGYIAQHNISQELIKQYEHPLPLEPIQQKMASTNEARDRYTTVKNRVENNNLELQRITQRQLKIQEEINNLQHELQQTVKKSDEIRTENSNCEKWFVDNPQPNSDEILQELNTAISHNKEHERIKGLREKHNEIQELHSGIMLSTGAVKKLQEERDKIIEQSNLPVKGLTWTDSEIYIDGLPLDETQINKSRIFDIGVDITIAMNPTLKTIFLHDGSLFDKDHMDSVLRKVESQGYNLIAECVGENNEMEIKYTETTIN